MDGIPVVFKFSVGERLRNKNNGHECVVAKRLIDVDNSLPYYNMLDNNEMMFAPRIEEFYRVVS